MLKKTLFYLPVFSIIISCGTKTDLSQQKKSVDSLKVELVRITNEFSQIDSAKVTAASTQIGAFFNFINPRIKDTITQSQANALSEFKNIARALGKYTRTKKELARYYDFNVKQLENLSFDLEKGNINNKDSAVKYLSQEIEANKQLMTMMKLHNEIIPKKLKRYDSLVPVVMQFAQKINNGEVPKLFESKETVKPSSDEEND